MFKRLLRRKPAAPSDAQPDLWSLPSAASGPALSAAALAEQRERRYLARWLAWRVDAEGRVREDVRPEEARIVPRLVAAARARGVDWQNAPEAAAVEAPGEPETEGESETEAEGEEATA